MEDEQRDKKLKLLDNQVRVLMQNFDSVHIFATKFETDGAESKTAHYVRGDGNWFTRYGQVREWLLRQENDMSDRAIGPE